MSEFKKYYDLKAAGSDAVSVYKMAKADSVDDFTIIRLIRQVFGLSLMQAKEVMIAATCEGKSLSDHLSNLQSDLEQALNEDGRLDDNTRGR